jgi:hypothetical protein
MDNGDAPETKETIMSAKKTTTALAAAACAMLLAACGDDETPANGYLRVAHLSPDAPAVDFCIAPDGTTAFTGPVMKSLGATAGLAYTQVSAYATVAAGAYDVRIVAPNAASCATSLAGLPDITNLPAVPAGGYVTAAAIGLLGSTATPFQLNAYVDEHVAPAGKLKLRFAHDSPGTPAVDVGVGQGAAFPPIFTNVAYPGFAAPSAIIDANGYATLDPITASVASPVDIVARVTGTTTDALVVPLTIPVAAGTVASAFAVGLLASSATPLEVVLCLDNAAASGAYSTCIVAP